MSATALPSPGTYTPGYIGAKRLMVVFGLLVFALGFWQLRTPLWLLVFGTRATAEAVDVVKTKTGLPDLVLNTNAQLQAALEIHDRSYIFWNDFQFEAGNARSIVVRAPAGSLLKPLYPLLDEDGLPTTDLVWFDPAHPEIATFPRMISVWFAPGTLLFIGFLAMLIGSVLLYWADKPIVLPHLRDAPEIK